MLIVEIIFEVKLTSNLAC